MNGPLGAVPPAEQLMTINRDDRNGCVVLVVHGEVDLSTGSRLMEAGSEALHQAGGQPVVLDLSDVDFLSSSGMGLLVALHDEGRGMHTALRVVVDEKRSVIRPIRTMGLDEVLSLFGSIDEAITA
jgi:anti-sigma B factor antagonist